MLLRMGHHGYLTVAGYQFLHSRGGYRPDLAALFTEDERWPDPPGTTSDEAHLVYATTAAQLRERPHVQGITATHARRELANTLDAWRAARFSIFIPRVVPSAQDVEDLVRELLPHLWEETWGTDQAEQCYSLMGELGHHMDSRCLTRLLVEWSPAPDTEVVLDLSELTGPGVDLDPTLPIAAQCRAEQLAALTHDAPLLVLTEGPTDARLLDAGMQITHSHLKGFINFFDFKSGGAEGGVGQLAKTVAAFAAAGVANRFVAISDNDTEGHAGLASLKRRALPERCRVLHYPELPFLKEYPTLGPYGEAPIIADVNGRAGSLEMYLGRDILETADGLLPVQWRSWDPKLRRYQGSLSDDDKKDVQRRFEDKVTDHLSGLSTGREDWTGIRAIIDAIVTAFD
ncbi:hypothetical protein ACWDQL_34410 [Streptomyces olivaceus]